MPRKPVSASLRWQVFARDNFTCRYCGTQAGQDGVALHADHIISVADGGDGTMDNLLTACTRCNGGKGAKSLKTVPSSEAMAEQMKKRAASIKAQAKSVRAALAADADLSQTIIDIKGAAYLTEDVRMIQGEMRIAKNLSREFGPDKLMYFYQTSAGNRVKQREAICYICGIAKRLRTEAADAQ